MPRPKGSLNKPKTASDAQMLDKASTRTSPTAGQEEDIKKVNKILSSFESQDLGTEFKVPQEVNEKRMQIKLSLDDVIKKMKEEMERELTPEEKISSLVNEVERLHKAIEKFNIVINYLETKLGIDE